MTPSLGAVMLVSHYGVTLGYCAVIVGLTALDGRLFSSKGE